MIIGLTGGIGSGKTTIATILKILGIPVYNADERGRWLTQEDENIKEGYKQLFGDGIYTVDGLNRKEVANQVFKDPKLLKRVNQLVHPVVNNDFKLWCEVHKEARLKVKEAAILFESGASKFLDASVLVYAPERIRIQRVMQRDGVDEESVRRRMKHQMDDEEKKKMADHIIYNDETKMLLPQIVALHNTILNK